MEGKRQTKYERLRMAERLESVRGWAQHGATMKELAGMLGVAESTVYAWRRAYPAFDEAVRKGADEANGEILGTAFRLATGYTQTVQEPVKVR